MAALSDLVSVLARTTGLPEATVFAYGRFAREAGFISQKGRGRGAAQMSVTDAANLVIALMGTDITREAGTAIKRYRPLIGFATQPNGRAGRRLMEWVAHLGLTTVTNPSDLVFRWLNFDLGTLLEFLIESARTDRLGKFLRSLEFIERTPENYAIQNRHPEAAGRIEKLIDLGASTLEPESVIIGVEIGFTLSLDRSDLRAHLEFSRFQHAVGRERLWDLTFQKDFLSSVGDLKVKAQLGISTVAALGWCLAGRELPERLQTPFDIQNFIFGQEQSAFLRRLMGIPVETP